MARYKYTYKDKETGKEFSLSELEGKHLQDFDSYSAFSAFLDEHYEEKRETILTPYERARSAVYATGNRWAIENFNATH